VPPLSFPCFSSVPSREERSPPSQIERVGIARGPIGGEGRRIPSWPMLPRTDELAVPHPPPRMSPTRTEERASRRPGPAVTLLSSRLDPAASPRPRSTLVLGSLRHRRGGPPSEGAGERGRCDGEQERWAAVGGEAEDGEQGRWAAVGGEAGDGVRPCMEREVSGVGWDRGRGGEKKKVEYDKWAPLMLVWME
jgi:hypothetical protein